MATDLFDKPCLLLCEGISDKQFFDHLLRKHGLDDKYQARFPAFSYPRTKGGRSHFGQYLNGAPLIPGYANLGAILVVSDNDEAPSVSFGEVQAQIKQVGRLGVPSSERVLIDSDPGNPPVCVLMLPVGGKQGNLETVCLEAANTKWPHIEEPLSQFVSKTDVPNWDTGRQSKMKLQSTLSATCKDESDIRFGYHWEQKECISLDHPCFATLVEYLKQFTATYL